MSQIGTIHHLDNHGHLQVPVAQSNVFRKLRSKLRPDMDKLKLHLGLLRLSEQTFVEPAGQIEGNPIHQLPDEILEEIILYTTRGSVDLCAPTSDAWTIGRVCSRWRNVIIKLSTLWCTIDIYKPNVTLEVVKKLLGICTTRARHRPLRLRLMDICQKDTFIDVLRLVSAHSHQWETFYVPVSMLKATLTFERGLGQLTSLELTGRYRGTAPLESFSSATNLSSLSLFHFPKPYLNLRMPWFNLRHLSISRCEFSAGEFAQLLRVIPNVVTFTYTWSNGVAGTGNSSCPEPISMPRMRRLGVELYQHELGLMLHHFILPSLTDLTISLVAARATRIPIPHIDNPILHLIRRSNCSLTRLSVSAVNSSSIFDMLEASPRIKDLELDLIPDAHLILEYLVQPDVLVPNLETISLSLKEDQGVRCVGPLLTLIRARSLTTGVLKQVLITMRESKGVGPFQKLLYPLRNDTGVRISITDYLRI